MSVTKLPLERRASPSLSTQVADAILRGAVEGALKPGQRLVEAELAKEFQVSRVPVREALRSLESQGIVYSANRETRLFQITERTLSDLLDVRTRLEPFAARVVIGRLKSEPDLSYEFEDLLDEMRKGLRRGSAYDVARADMDFHRAMYVATGNELLVEVWDLMSRKLLITVGLNLYEQLRPTIVAEHELLLDLMRAGDVEALDKVLIPHINEAKMRDGAL